MSDLVHTLDHQPYDLMLRHKNPLALRLHDAHHQNINVGDLVDVQGHGSIMDRQRFKVIGKMNSPTIGQAINQIQHSNLSVRDKIMMSNSFRDVHAPQLGSVQAAENHPVVTLHLQPHPAPPPMLGH